MVRRGFVWWYGFEINKMILFTCLVDVWIVFIPLLLTIYLDFRRIHFTYRGCHLPDAPAKRIPIDIDRRISLNIITVVPWPSESSPNDGCHTGGGWCWVFADGLGRKRPTAIITVGFPGWRPRHVLQFSRLRTQVLVPSVVSSRSLFPSEKQYLRE